MGYSGVLPVVASSPGTMTNTAISQESKGRSRERSPLNRRDEDANEAETLLVTLASEPASPRKGYSDCTMPMFATVPELSEP
jgi:hypothetical protein